MIDPNIIPTLAATAEKAIAAGHSQNDAFQFVGALFIIAAPKATPIADNVTPAPAAPLATPSLSERLAAAGISPAGVSAAAPGAVPAGE